MYSSREEQSPPAEAPAPGPAELKSTMNGEDARPAGLLHEPHELSTSTLAKLEAASDDQKDDGVVRAMARMGPRGRRPPVNNKPSFIS